MTSESQNLNKKQANVAQKRVFPPLIQDLLARMMAPRFTKPKMRVKPAAGLWPTDKRGQYISAKPTSKRNQHRSVA